MWEVPLQSIKVVNAKYLTPTHETISVILDTGEMTVFEKQRDRREFDLVEKYVDIIEPFDRAAKVESKKELKARIEAERMAQEAAKVIEAPVPQPAAQSPLPVEPEAPSRTQEEPAPLIPREVEVQPEAPVESVAVVPEAPAVPEAQAPIVPVEPIVPAPEPIPPAPEPSTPEVQQEPVVPGSQQ